MRDEVDGIEGIGIRGGLIVLKDKFMMGSLKHDQCMLCVGFHLRRCFPVT